MNKSQRPLEWCKPGKNTLDTQSKDSDSNPDSSINLTLIQTSEHKIMDKFISNFHTYKPSSQLVGRGLNYWIKDGTEIIGIIGFSNPYYTIG